MTKRSQTRKARQARGAKATAGTVYHDLAFTKFKHAKLQKQRDRQLGTFGSASTVRRIDPATGEVVEEIAVYATPKIGKRKKAPKTLDEKATDLLSKNAQRKGREKRPKERNQKEIRGELSRLRKLRKRPQGTLADAAARIVAAEESRSPLLRTTDRKPSGVTDGDGA
jgi:hypothetical protein